ncbi:MAG TPA: polysaccharide deacetylase family protein [Xanthobacteraceae bacterium]|jgi:peptidoglycan/xylan/chitin deacetylase (PgdA/CDA1 family)|nr:polysaccharide deacetylase family protein [Xanthobacteraceae bacterium]
MRFVISIVAALMILGLAAFGVVSAQKMSTAPSQATASDSAAAPAPQAAPAAARHHPAVNPVSQVAQTSVETTPAASTPAASAPAAPAPMRVAQATQTTPAAPSAASAPPKPAPSATAIPACDKPGGMGLTRIVEIDTTGGPGFGFEHFKQYDFLRDKEVVLTFDDGPWPGNTPAVLKALTDECLKATFFEIGEHATWHPEITKQVIAAGMTVGTHTWSHKDLARNPYAKDIEQAKAEIEMGNSAVHLAAGGGKIAPFFRFPALQHPPQLMSYLAERNIGVFSTDIDSRDFKLHKPEDVIKSVMSQLEKHGKGIILMHDFKHHTAEAMPELIRQLKAGGYKVVHMVPKGELTTVPKYDEMLAHEDKLSSNNTRPESSVIRTIGE